MSPETSENESAGANFAPATSTRDVEVALARALEGFCKENGPLSDDDRKAVGQFLRNTQFALGEFADPPDMMFYAYFDFETGQRELQMTLDTEASAQFQATGHLHLTRADGGAA